MTIADPFAPAQPAADEAQSQQPETAPSAPQSGPWESPEVKTPAPVVNVAPVPSEGKIVTTLKGGTAFSDPWVVIHANTVEESDALLDQKLADYLGKVKRVASFFNGGTGAPAQAAPAQPQLQPGQPRGSVEPPAWAPPKPFDDFVYKTGLTKSGPNIGKPWHAWMPPQQGDSRPAKFFRQP